MDELNVLWLDDDTPTKVQELKGVNVMTARSCEEADRLLAARKCIPDCAVVDLIVPQGKWGNGIFKTPGLQYLKDLKRRYGDSLVIIVYSIIITPRMRLRIDNVGVDGVYSKYERSWGDLITQLSNDLAQDRLKEREAYADAVNP